MDQILFLVIGLLIGGVLGWYWAERKYGQIMAQAKIEFDERHGQSLAEIKAANLDNQDLRDQLVNVQLDHQHCGPKIAEIEAKLAALSVTAEGDASEPSPSVTSELDALRIATLESQLVQERERRTALRAEFEKIEQQLAQSGLGAIQMAGDSMSLHEASVPFELDQEPEVSGEGASTSDAPMALFGQTEDAEPDDLKRIKGIGPVLERKLHSLGVRQFSQIAEFSPDDVAKIDAVLNFKGRIERENWIEQAREMGQQQR